MKPLLRTRKQPCASRSLGKAVGVVSDGSALLGPGNIGPSAAIPVMEGNAMLFKEFAGIHAWPICIDTQDAAEIIETVRRIAPVFGGINLEDFGAPKCFQIEDALQDLGIPVFHDDQHGTPIVLLTAWINASRVVDRPLETLSVVINGAGAAGTAIAKLSRCVGQDSDVCIPVKHIAVCDSKGAIHAGRTDLNPQKEALLAFTNLEKREGILTDVLQRANVLFNVSKGNLIGAPEVQSMADRPIILAMANPTPEIMQDVARKAGTAVVGIGRSDFPNQVNNMLAFPGIFRGALDAGATGSTESMNIAAAMALTDADETPSAEQILPDPLDLSVAPRIAAAVSTAWEAEIGL